VLELVTPSHQKGTTDVKMELRKGVCAFRQVGIPHPDGILHADFSHQQTIHPSKRELHEFDILGVEVR
jgi:hypothetical protein